MNSRWDIAKHIFLLVLGLVLIACSEESHTRSQLLKQTPIGSSFDQVLAFCAGNNFKCFQSKTAGFLNQETGKVIGVMSIWTVISELKDGQYTIKSVAAYWGFGQDGKLIDIWVWKTIDAP